MPEAVPVKELCGHDSAFFQDKPFSPSEYQKCKAEKCSDKFVDKQKGIIMCVVSDGEVDERARQEINAPTNVENRVDASDESDQLTTSVETPVVVKTGSDFSVQVDSYSLSNLPPEYAQVCQDAPKFSILEIVADPKAGAAAEVVAQANKVENWRKILVHRRLEDYVNGRSFHALTSLEPPKDIYFRYAQQCHLNDDGVPDALITLDDNKGFWTVLTKIDMSLPLGASIMSDVDGHQSESVRILPDQSQQACEFVYSIRYYENLSPEMEMAYNSATQDMTREEFRDLLEQNFPDGKMADIGGSQKEDPHVSLTLKNSAGLYAEVTYRFDYLFSHARAVTLTKDKLPDFIVDTTEGGFLVFQSERPSGNAENGVMCIEDESAEFPPAWQFDQIKPGDKKVTDKATRETIELPEGVTPGAKPNTFAIENKVFFDFDKSTITTEGENSLSKVYALIQTIQKQSKDPVIVEVHGHTDYKGSDEYNDKLSKDRGESVKNLLVKFGMTAQNIINIPHGESDPVATNLTEEGRAANRRVEFKIKSSGNGSEEVYTVIVSGRDQSVQMDYKPDFSKMNWQIRMRPYDDSKPYSIRRP